MDKYLISRVNVANLEYCENGVTRKIPHGDFEKLAGMDHMCDMVTLGGKDNGLEPGNHIYICLLKY